MDLSAPLKGSGPSPRQTIFYYWNNELRAVRKGPYKGHFVTSGAYGLGGERVPHDPPLLFDLRDDAGENHDVASAHPDVVADLIQEAATHKAAMKMGKPLFDEVLTPPK